MTSLAMLVVALGRIALPSSERESREPRQSRRHRGSRRR
jgi:hypothetical protein